MVLFRCDWYNQEGKTVGIKDDEHFKSININSFWYKSDPFILATQSTKIFYLQDNDLGNDWRVVQKFEHKGIYDVPEKDGTYTKTITILIWRVQCIRAMNMLLMMCTA